MAYIVLARKWRPKTFEEVIGQEHITTTLKNAIKSGRIAHAYLFSGPRGIGKTTTARLLAKSLNCVKGPTPIPCNQCSACQEISSGENLDVLEIDGASNRGIDEIRSLRENVKFTPASSKYKIYIIDEVHMLTTEAFNALLKTLEEPPLHVKFIFATTQPFRVPSTILSRCQRFDFRLISIQELVQHLKKIAQAEKIDISDGALLAMARSAEGSMRDAQSILDQLISFSGEKINESDVYTLLGTVKEEIFEELTQAIVNRDTRQGLKIINSLLNEGKDLRYFLSACLEHFRNLVVLKLSKDLNQLIDLPPQAIKRLETLTEQFSLEELLEIIYLLAEVEGELRGGGSIKLALEMAVIRLTELPRITSLKDILNRLADLEKKLEGGERQSVKEGERQNIKKSEGESFRGEESQNVNQVETQKREEPEGEEGEKEERNQALLSQLQELWPEIIMQIRKLKITAAAFLVESKPIKLSRRILTLSFKPNCNFHKESIEGEDNRRLIEKVLKEKFGKDLIINCVLSREEKSSEDNALESSLPKKSHDPLIEKILHLFKGEIIEGE